MNAQYRKRLAKLERTQRRDMAWLTLPDGSVVTVSDTDNPLRACGRAVQGLQLNADEEALVDLVKQSVDVKGTGDQGMIEVYRAVLLSPLEDEFYPVKGGVGPEGSVVAATFSESEPSEDRVHPPRA